MVESESVIQSFFQKLNYNRLSTRSIAALMFGIIFLGFLFPKILKYGMKTQLRVTPGTKTRKLFEVVPFAIDFNIYLWNVTNPDEVMAGKKPKLQELGPYSFDEYKSKGNIQDNADDDTVEYDYLNHFVYRPDKNGGGLTGDETVIVAHPMILGMFLALNIDRTELLDFALNAINGLFRDPKDIFFTGPAKDLLFNGVVIDCSSDAYEVIGVCAELDSEEYTQVERLNETALQFSLFGNSNGTSIGRFKVKRGKENINELGKILLYNDEPVMYDWDDDACNEIRGSDGTIFPPFQKKEDGYWIFAGPICRSLHATHQERSQYAGIRTERFSSDLGVGDTENPSCWCREDKCPLNGTFDLYPCIGVPMTVTSPHFLKADPSLFETIESGLSPNVTKHGFRMDFYQFAGAPLSAVGRLQFSLEVSPIEVIPIMQNLQQMYLPFMWVEEGVDLDKEFTNMIKYQLVLVLKIQKYLKILCVLGGILGIIISATGLYFQIDDEKVHTVKDGVSNIQVKSVEVLSNTNNVIIEDGDKN